MRALGVVVLFAAGALGIFYAWGADGEQKPTEDTGSLSRSLSDRVIASQGFIPPGAPLKPPPRPAPRDGALAIEFGELAGFEFELESGVVPDAVAAHDGKRIEVVGVMYFAVADPERVTAFFLMPDHNVCC